MLTLQIGSAIARPGPPKTRYTNYRRKVGDSKKRGSAGKNKCALLRLGRRKYPPLFVGAVRRARHKLRRLWRWVYISAVN